MLNSELWGFRRAALAATTVVLTAVMSGCMGPPPVAAEPPPQPSQAPAADAPQAQEDPAQAGGEDDAKVDDFYEPLAAYGTWVDTPEYGKAWQPADDVAGETFVPYASDGAWAANDDGDWVFESRYDNEFGWATYHYGRWVDHDDYGWVWIPGTTWAPAQVEWRYGGGYVGWVPRGPDGYVVYDTQWFFVEQRYFGSPAVYQYRLGPDRASIAYYAAPPIVEVRGGRYYAGPPVARLRAEGVAVRGVHTRAPGRGYVRNTGRTVRTAAASRHRPAARAHQRNAAAKAAHHEAKAVKHEQKAAHHEQQAAKHEEKAAKHEEKAAHHEAKAVKHEEKAAHHETKKAPPPPPKAAPKKKH
jgi:hypothetical protein